MPTLNWIGKDKVINHHLDVPYRILDRQYTHNADASENKIIHGDNLEALKALLPQYENRIKCIYIDPPYNTGNEGWVYNDNVNDPKIKRWLGEVVGKESEDLTRHDKWLCMMYPRLKLLYRLLADDGAIFISIDDNEQANLRLVCDEIFGGGNFISNIAVVNNFKGRSDDKYIATSHENILLYQKGNFATNGVPIPEEYQSEYKEKDKRGKYRLLGLRKRGSNAREIDRPNLFYPIYYNPEKDTISLEEKLDWIKIIPQLSNKENGTWRWGKETLLRRQDEIEIRLVKGRNEYDLFQKDYLQSAGDLKTIKPKSFWHGSEFSSEAGTLQLKKIFQDKTFPTPKSVNLIEYCLYQATSKDSIILDSFSGSGTTAHAVLNLNKQDGGNRKFILVEMEDYADSITAERVKRVIDGYGEGKNQTEGTAGNFSYYELGQPLFIEDDYLNEELPLQEIHRYIWYTETARPFDDEPKDHTYLLGVNDNASYYFYYEKESLTTLNHEFLSTITRKSDTYVIYADNCVLPKEFMTKNNIIFKKIPRDITRF